MDAAAKLSSLIVLTTLLACADSEPEPDIGVCDESQARSVVARFGERLRTVSVLAPDSVADRDIRQAYAPVVTAALLERWLDHPARAPGRQVSSPWPARLDIHAVAPVPDGCRIEGDIVLVTNADTVRAVAREPITLLVTDDDGWRISEFTATASADSQDAAGRAQSGSRAAADSAANGQLDPPADSAGAAAAADVIRHYYAMIQAGDLADAYALWRDRGAASGQTFDAFAAGYAQTERVSATVGSPGPIGAAAGSRYVRVPVSVEAVIADGTTQRFEGTYTLSRSVVDGATPTQRRWRISSADMRRTSG